MSDRITAFFAKTQPWQQEFSQLRSLLLECGLEEGYKWGWPCYMQEGANIVLMHGFKQYCALLLFKGALLDDADGLLAQQPELQAAFHALTPGRQRAYLLHFSKAKQSATRTARVQNCIPRILEGKGLDD
jgi:uncharacterized protein YdeI (YjbR/CyaY-like superfamily)